MALYVAKQPKGEGKTEGIVDKGKPTVAKPKAKQVVS